MAVQARGDLRGLKILVAAMGVLIVLGTALVIGVIAHRILSPRPSEAVATPVADTAQFETPQLRPGERVRSITAAGPELAIWVSGPEGDRVLLLDPGSNAVRQILMSAP